MSHDTLHTYPLFLSLTRPTLFMGVHLTYLCLCGFIVFSAFLLLQSLLPCLLWPPLHLAGWILCRLDPHLFGVLAVRTTLTGVPNKTHWGCQSYAPY